MEKFTQVIAEALSESGSINAKDKELYRYGIEVFVICVLEMCAILIASLAVGNFMSTIIYFAGFLPIRTYGGGYHAKTRLGCFLILVSVYGVFSVLNSIAFMPKYNTVIMAAAILNIAITAVLSPLPNANKTVSANEKIIYRRRSILFATAELIPIILCIGLSKYNEYIQAFVLGLFSASLSLIAGKIKITFQGGGIKNG